MLASLCRRLQTHREQEWQQEDHHDHHEATLKPSVSTVHRSQIRGNAKVMSTITHTSRAAA